MGGRPAMRRDPLTDEHVETTCSGYSRLENANCVKPALYCRATLSLMRYLLTTKTDELDSTRQATSHSSLGIRPAKKPITPSVFQISAMEPSIELYSVSRPTNCAIMRSEITWNGWETTMPLTVNTMSRFRLYLN